MIPWDSQETQLLDAFRGPLYTSFKVSELVSTKEELQEEFPLRHAVLIAIPCLTKTSLHKQLFMQRETTFETIFAQNGKQIQTCTALATASDSRITGKIEIFYYSRFLPCLKPSEFSYAKNSSLEIFRLPIINTKTSQITQDERFLYTTYVYR